jgi:hypothetical protein
VRESAVGQCVRAVADGSVCEPWRTGQRVRAVAAHSEQRKPRLDVMHPLVRVRVAEDAMRRYGLEVRPPPRRGARVLVAVVVPANVALVPHVAAVLAVPSMSVHPAVEVVVDHAEAVGVGGGGGGGEEAMECGGGAMG